MKSKKTQVMIIAGIFMIFLIGSVLAADGYCFKRLTNGQTVLANFKSSTKHLYCDGTKCTVRGFSGSSSFLQICTDSANYYSSYNKCEDLCEGITNGTNPQNNNLTLSASFPFSNGGVFTKQTFFMDIKTNKIVSLFLIDNVRGTSRSLCPNCNSYQRSITFKQGFNDITIRAVKGNEVQEKRITFMIDNQKPVVTKSLPLTNKFASGQFSITYNEDNLKSIKLYYGDTSNPKIANLSGCTNGKAQTCTRFVNLSSYEGKTIYYWFNVLDLAGNLVTSKPVKVYVDMTAPVLNSLNYTISRKLVTFNLKITDANFYRAYYSDNGAKQKILCTSLKNSLCTGRFTFKTGHHDVDVVVSDKAGNNVTKSISFDI